jgi:hypothetical protein
MSAFGFERPAFLGGKIAEKPFDGMDTYCRIESPPIAIILTRVIADPAMYGRQGIVTHQHFPSFAVSPCLRKVEPCLNVFPCGTCVVAGGQQVDINRATISNGTRASGSSQINDPRHIAWLNHR